MKTKYRIRILIYAGLVFFLIGCGFSGKPLEKQPEADESVVVTPMERPDTQTVHSKLEPKPGDKQFYGPVKTKGGLKQYPAASPAPMTFSMMGTLKRKDAGYGGHPQFNTEAYDFIAENGYKNITDHPLSTFSIDVDTASYANIRRFLNQGRLPPKDAVRIEEMINYFSYKYPAPDRGQPFSVNYELAACPWLPKHRLLRIGLKGETISPEERPEGNIVFLLDVSGSMNAPEKLPLLKKAMKMLINNLTEKDRVAIVVYAGASGAVLPSTQCTIENKPRILDALRNLSAGGSTHGSAGIELAYRIAVENYKPEGINRVILATDGDFNVGATNKGALVRMVASKAETGVFLTVLGFGMGNLKDDTMESIADKGNGNYGYIDSLQEARKMLVEQIGGTLVTIAKDVKIQVEFNPAKVAAYRLIGYENRLLNKEDFNDDAKDAGEIGAGHTVTAFYEIVPAGQTVPVASVDPLKYQQTTERTKASELGELVTIKLRYKQPNGSKSKLLTYPVPDRVIAAGQASADFKFAAAVAGFGMILRDSSYKNSLTYDDAVNLALSGKGADHSGLRAEFINLVRLAKELDKEQS